MRSKSNHRQFKQRLSTNKYVTSKQKTKVVQSRKKQSVPSTNKQYSASVKHRDGSRDYINKGYKNAKRSTTKLQKAKTKTMKHHNKSENKSSTHSRKSKSKRSSHSKTKNVRTVKSHH
jgi:hypothetical protein